MKEISFVEIIKDILVENNLSQNQLAKILNIHSGRVSEWINGKAKPGFDNLRTMCLALNISGDQILGIDDKKI